MNHIKGAYIFCAILLLNTLFLVVAIEIPFRIAHDILDYHHDHGFRHLFHHSTASSSPASSAEDEKLQEEDDIAAAYQPYEEFRVAPFTGRSINIQTDGFRFVPGQNKDPSFTVWILGESTTYGSGTSDGLTIPAILQDLFNTQTHLKVNVYNRGVGGWGSSQEMIYLVDQLRTGHVPNIVFFYGGLSDIVHAVQNGAAGTTSYHWPLIHFFRGDTDLVNFTAGRRGWFRIRFMSFIIKRLRKCNLYRGPFIPFVEQPDYDLYSRVYNDYPQLSDAQKEKLAQDVFEIYKENVLFVRTLSKIYHFTPYFVWQPLDFIDKHPGSPHAYTMRKGPFGYVDLTARVMPYINGNTIGIINLSHALDDMDKNVFSDSVHILPRGNKRVAQLLFSQIRQSAQYQLALKDNTAN
jgi:hypothetical protein